MIEFRNVEFRYPGDPHTVLRLPDLQIREGSSVAIMGANGSGKSTTAFCMNGMLVPTAGDVLVDGLNTADRLSLSHIRRRVGVVFQDPNLQFTSMSVERELAFGLENLGVPSEVMRRQVEDQLRAFNLKRIRDCAPSILSGGEKQRLAVAAVMILHPGYLILDEATSLLSAASRRALLQLVGEVVKRSGATLIMITQFPHEAFTAERLIVLHRGAVAFDDAPRTVFRNARDLTGMGVPVPLTMRLALDEV